MKSKFETATLAGGCFWCTEAIFKRIQGVKSVIPGYTGGVLENPSYTQVAGGSSGHAEATQIIFDPGQVSYKEILDIFWHTHDPTTLNRQGNDVGSQYRSAIFFHNKKQKESALHSKTQLELEEIFPDPIVTEIVPYTIFYPAEDYHKNYFERNKDEAYCRLVIAPKIRKLLAKYAKKIKKDYSRENN